LKGILRTAGLALFGHHHLVAKTSYDVTQRLHFGFGGL
jgi:hypothetical protein